MITGLMSVAVAPGRWRVTWGSSLGSPVYRVWVDGVRWPDQTAGVLDVTVAEGGALQVDVYDQDEPDARPQKGLSRQVTVRWSGIATALGYRVETRTGGGGWVTRGRLPHAGLGEHALAVGPLADDAVHELRVVAETAGGDEVIEEGEEAEVAGVPTPPEQVVEYDGEEGVLSVGG